jgi:hypothetical protein
MSITLSALQKQRTDTAANWTSANPTLLAGELGFESDTGKVKLGTGSTAWTSLGYLGVIPSSGTYPLSQLIMPLGTAGAPPLTFVGDLNTGIYSPGADQVAISTNGTGRLFINSAGNAVIGSNTVQTFTGYTSLTLDNATNGGVLCINKNAVNIANISATNDALSIDAAGGGSSPIVFRTGAATTERLRITSAGLVGVGTSSPNVPLQVIGGSTVTDPVIRATNSGATQSMALTSAGLRMDGGVPIQIYQGGSEVVRIDTSGRLGIGDSGPDSTLTIKAAASTTPLRISGPSSEFARIDSSGNFGIASSGNLSKLTVNSGNNLSSTALVAFNTQNANINGLTISNWTGSATTQGPRIAFDNSGNSGWIIGGANGNAGFDICQSWGTPLVRIDGSGRVGIGATPDSKLHVVDAIGNALRIGYDSGVTNKNIYDANQHLFRDVNGNSSVTIDSSKRLLVGTSSALNVEPFVAAQVQTEARYGYASIYRANDASGPALYFIKSRAASAATVVQSGDVLGEIRFQGADGGDYETPGGTIKCEVDGTPGANDMPGRLVFSTTADGASSPTERMRIGNSGTIQVGATGLVGWINRIPLQVGQGAVAWQSTPANGASTIFSNNFYVGAGGNDRAISTGYVEGIVMNSAGAGDVRVLTTSGTVTAGDNFSFTAGPYVAAGGTSWTSSSDERLKNIIEPITNGLEKVADIRAVKFSWKDDPDAKPNIGVIAQDVEAVLPEIVSKSKKYGSDDPTEYLGVSYDLLAPLLIAALQEAKIKIETLEARLTAAGIE